MADEQQRTTIVFDDSDEYRPEPPAPPEPAFWKDGSIRIGIHTSIAGDITGALEIAHGLGANALQIFSASPRMWARGNSRIPEADAKRFRERRAELRLGPLAIHANYLINLASPNPVLRAQSVQTFHQEIVRAMALGADFLIVHPGSATDGTRDSAVANVAQSLKQAVRGVKLGDLRILLENTAGQGSCIGCDFAELRRIIDSCPELPMGVCIDTAHLFAMGWDLRAQQGIDRTLDEIERVIGLEHIPVIHVNDSKARLGSRVDRHEHIGKGMIGRDAFRLILNHPRLAGRAFLLETPVDKAGDDKRNVAALWRFAGKIVRATGDGMKPRRKTPRRAKPTAPRAKRSGKSRTTQRA